MPRLTNKVPSYCRHKASGQAVVTLNGKDFYLGTWGSPESRAAYDQRVKEWLASGRGKPKGTGKAAPPDPSVAEVILAFWNFAEIHYMVSDPKASRELDNLRDALRPLRKLYGETPARLFGPLKLRSVREAMVRSGLARTTVNARVNRIRRVFRWAGSVEMVPGEVHRDLQTVEGLRAMPLR